MVEKINVAQINGRTNGSNHGPANIDSQYQIVRESHASVGLQDREEIALEDGSKYKG